MDPFDLNLLVMTVVFCGGTLVLAAVIGPVANRLAKIRASLD
ncbi:MULTISPECIES: hypothetical protein [Gluconobacter]|nr:hypothetical protein [Gluconobacter oxydans]TCW25532.1 hypothetical protein EDC20_1131 [Gluconobacter oxydans]